LVSLPPALVIVIVIVKPHDEVEGRKNSIYRWIKSGMHQELERLDRTDEPTSSSTTYHFCFKSPMQWMQWVYVQNNC